MSLLGGILACILPQDCELQTRPLKGKVVDSVGIPVAGIKVIGLSGEPEFYNQSEHIFFETLTDDMGRFSTNGVSAFLCEKFIISVTSPAGDTFSFTYGGWAGTATYNASYQDVLITLPK
ncbi:MAG: hypothetical protein R3E39_02220 [Anaerolineae bacterium]